eukprot:gene2973-3711_t
MSIVACVSVAFSTMALIIVLSVFNGMEGALKKLFKTFDPTIKIALVPGKHFVIPSNLMEQIASTPGVEKAVEVMEETVLLSYRGRQLVAKLKGVSENFLQNGLLEKQMVQGEWVLEKEDKNFALIGAGIQYALSIRLNNAFELLQIFYPTFNKKHPFAARELYQTQWIHPGAVFSVEKYFDDHYVIVPLRVMAHLVGNSDQRTAIEIEVVPGYSTVKVQQALQVLLPSFKVLNQDQQQMSLVRAIHIERVLVFAAFALIVVVASLNIFFILSMLVLSKRSNIALLYTLGATPSMIRYSVLLHGLLIGLGGALVGMLLGGMLTWLQQKFGLVSMDMQTGLLNAYPVIRKLGDFIYVGIGVLCATLLASYRPALLASKTKIKAYWKQIHVCMWDHACGCSFLKDFRQLKHVLRLQLIEWGPMRSLFFQEIVHPSWGYSFS